MSKRYRYIGDCDIPGRGSEGEAERGAYYVDPDRDLEYIGRDVSEWSDAQRLSEQRRKIAAEWRWWRKQSRAGARRAWVDLRNWRKTP